MTGLLVNELVTNATKHAFPDGREGEILVWFASLEDGTVSLHVSDNGVGCRSDARAGTGQDLIRLLAQQLKAEPSLQNDRGTTISVHFRPEEAPLDATL